MCARRQRKRVILEPHLAQYRSALCREVLVAWAAVIATSRARALEASRLWGCSAKAVTCVAVQGWSGVVAASKQLRALEKQAKQTLARSACRRSLRNRWHPHAAALRRVRLLLGKAFGCRGKGLTKMVFSPWAEFASQARRVRLAESKAKQTLARLACRRSLRTRWHPHAAALRRVRLLLGEALGCRGKGLTKMVFAPWAEFASEARRERLAESKALRCFAGLSMQWSFKAWSHCTFRRKRNRRVAIEMSKRLLEARRCLSFMLWVAYRSQRRRKKRLLPLASALRQRHLLKQLLALWTGAFELERWRCLQLFELLTRAVEDQQHCALNDLRRLAAAQRLWRGARGRSILQLWRTQAKRLYRRRQLTLLLIRHRQVRCRKEALRTWGIFATVKQQRSLSRGLASSHAQGASLRRCILAWQDWLQELHCAQQAAQAHVWQVVHEQLAICHFTGTCTGVVLRLWSEEVSKRHRRQAAALLLKSCLATRRSCHALARWHRKAAAGLRYRRLSRAAEELSKHSALNNFMQAWHHCSVRRRRNRGVLEQVFEQRGVDSLSRHFRDWHRSYTLACQERAQEAKASSFDRVCLFRSALMVWRQTAAELLRERSQSQVACNLCLQRLLVKSFTQLAKYAPARRNCRLSQAAATLRLRNLRQLRGFRQLQLHSRSCQARAEKRDRAALQLFANRKGRGVHALLEFATQRCKGHQMMACSRLQFARRSRNLALRQWRSLAAFRARFRRIASQIFGNSRHRLSRLAFDGLRREASERRWERRLLAEATSVLGRAKQAFVFDAWHVYAESRARRRALAVRSAAFCDSALRALVFASWGQQVTARLQRRGRQELVAARMRRARRQAAFGRLRCSASARRESRARALKVQAHTRTRVHVADARAGLSIWSDWAGRRRRQRVWERASQEMKAKQEKTRAVREWHRSALDRRRKSELRQRLSERLRRRLSGRVWTAWQAHVARKLRLRQLLASVLLRRVEQHQRAVLQGWLIVRRQQQHRCERLFRALHEAKASQLSSTLFRWRVHSFAVRLASETLRESLLSWQHLVTRLRHARLRAEGPLRRRAEQQAAALVLDAWLMQVAASQVERIQARRLAVLVSKAFLRPAWQLWRLQRLAELCGRAFLRSVCPACIEAWHCWCKSRTEARRQLCAAKRRLALSHALRRLHTRQRTFARFANLRSSLSASSSARCFQRAFRAWRSWHAAATQERRWLAKRSSLLQWKKALAWRSALKITVLHALARAADHDRRRLSLAVLRWWSWKAAWTSANLEASARLVEESRHHRERRRRQRRREVGPTAEELEVLEAAFRPWRTHVENLQRKLQRAGRQVSRQHGMLLLISLDHWVEAVLPTRRAENLRRRRHVRFNLTAAAPHAQSGGQPRRRSVGAVGQWAQTHTKWQVAAALAEGSSFVEMVSEDWLHDYSESGDCMSPGSIGSPAPGQLLDATATVPIAAAPPSSDATSLTWPALNGAAARSSAEGTGGTSTPSVVDTPLRQTPASTPRTTIATGAPNAKSNVTLDDIGQASLCRSCGNAFSADAVFCRHCGQQRVEAKIQQEPVTYMPLGVSAGGKMIPLHLKQDQVARELQTPQAFALQTPQAFDRRPAVCPPTEPYSGDILRFFKMRSAQA
eukprot:TRINITY_DN9031_c0_g1_i1.p1 TRINITY_DN9031_c0_g1~~TRINITY_DN9031_c0_g1_i1.p1  ORF type:complete len:1710 (-),score=260.03 TRINITY_DN9031_c0_g1_i1:78-4973(-)